MSAGSARRKLLHDIETVHGGVLELPAKPIIEQVFSIQMPLAMWARAHDIDYELNYNPDPAFRCPLTIIFHKKPTLDLFNDENDYEL